MTVKGSRRLLFVLVVSALFVAACDETTDSLFNLRPTADAGPDLTATVGETVELDGRGSSDPEGESLSFSWRFVSQPPGSSSSLEDADRARSRFTPEQDGRYEVELRVSDGRLSSTDRVAIDVDQSAGEVVFEIDPELTPRFDTLPRPATDGAMRPVAVLHVEGDDFQSEFVADEIIVQAKGSVLDAFVDRWGGKIVRRIEPEPEGFQFEPRYVVRIETERADADGLTQDLLRLSPQAAGRMGVSTRQGLELLAAVAAESVDGVEADVNWLIKRDQATATFNDRSTQERPLTSGGFSDAFSRNYMRVGGAQDIGVTEAWIALERAGKLSNEVTIAVIDGGFAINNDFPASVVSFTTEGPGTALGTPIPNGCGGNCPWHGTGAVGAAMGLPENQYGGAGPAGPVANAVTVHFDFSHGAAIDALGIVASRAPIISMSFSGQTNGIWAFTISGYAKFVRDVYLNGNLMYAAAGNDNVDIDEGESTQGDPKIHTPCEFRGVACVGALANNANTKIGFSNFGGNHFASSVQSDGTVDIFGPTNIRVGEYPNTNQNNSFGGTSAATPFVAGVAALIKAADPSQSANQVASQMILNANRGSSDSRVPQWVNARDAVLAALGVDNPPFITIADPQPGTQRDEGVELTFRAEVDDLDTDPADYIISWKYDENGTPFTFGTSESGTVLRAAPFCDGTYEVTAEALDPATNATAAATTNVVIDDLGATAPPDQCAPSVDILDPVGGMTYRANTDITLEADIDDDHPETDVPLYPVVWRSGGPNGPVLGQGLEITASFGPTNNQRIHVEYGAASDSVSIRVIDTTNEPPVGRIIRPDDGDAFVGSSAGGLVDVPVAGLGIDPEDGRIPAARVVWTYRQVGTANWSTAGTGEQRTIQLQDQFCTGSTPYDIRLTVTDSNGLSSVDTIRISVRGLIC